jgi:two-component system, NtrC family, response regulator AtoC
MPGRTIIFGNIADKNRLRKLSERQDGTDSGLQCHDAPTLFETGAEQTLVFVDLDDPRFAASDFLVSVATAGQHVKLIGKAQSPCLEETKRVARLGVSEVLSADECLMRLEQVLRKAEDVRTTDNTPISRYGCQSLIGASPQMNDIRETVRVLSEVDFPSALILGETGTGKSLISKVLHYSGVRAHHNLVEVNCSAIPEELFESEVFGHVKGAFTDAKSDKRGLFEYANGGTLFLDEVGTLSGSAQAKLLKIVEDKKLRKVGTVDELDINVRVVAATNMNLQEAIGQGRFREDLFFRLNLLTVQIPPLRERPEDIPELIDYYLAYYATNYGKHVSGVSAEATRRMQQHRWPGNVRELCNVIERAVLLGKGKSIDVEDVGLALKDGRVSLAERRQIVIDIPTQGVPLDEIEQTVVKQVLNMFAWNKSATAEFLGISRPRLRRIIEAAGLERDRRKV